MDQSDDRATCLHGPGTVDPPAAFGTGAVSHGGAWRYLLAHVAPSKLLFASDYRNWGLSRSVVPGCAIEESDRWEEHRPTQCLWVTHEQRAARGWPANFRQRPSSNRCHHAKARIPGTLARRNGRGCRSQSLGLTKPAEHRDATSTRSPLATEPIWPFTDYRST